MPDLTMDENTKTYQAISADTKYIFMWQLL